MGFVEGYDVDEVQYRLRFGVDEYTEKLLFEDVLKLLPKSWFKRMHDANVAAAHYALSKAAHAVCYASEGKPMLQHPGLDDMCQFTQPASHRAVALHIGIGTSTCCCGKREHRESICISCNRLGSFSSCARQWLLVIQHLAC